MTTHLTNYWTKDYIERYASGDEDWGHESTVTLAKQLLATMQREAKLLKALQLASDALAHLI